VAQEDESRYIALCIEEPAAAVRYWLISSELWRSGSCKVDGSESEIEPTYERAAACGVNPPQGCFDFFFFACQFAG
jgi:hypothetical protein